MVKEMCIFAWFDFWHFITMLRTVYAGSLSDLGKMLIHFNKLL